MAINLSDNIKISGNIPVDSLYYDISAPYSSVASVNSKIISNERYTGLTVNIRGTEYWYASGIADVNLVPKGMASSVTGVTNGLNLTNSTIKLGGALIENTSLTGAYTLNICSGAKLNTTCGYQISGTTMFRTSPTSLSTIYIGQNSGGGAIGGNCNIGIGVNTLSGNTTGTFNTAIGQNGLRKNSSGNNNNVVGYGLVNNTTGSWNNAFGTNILLGNTTGCLNNAFGATALCKNTTGSGNNAFGANTLMMNTTGVYNVAVGDSALYDNNGCRNTAIGTNALTYNTSGSWSVAIGADTMWCNCTGSGNTAMGTRALYMNKVGCYNVAIGYYAGYNETGSNKLYIANNSACNLIYGDFAANIVTLPTLKLCNTPTTGTQNDSLLVWNSTDKCVKSVTVPSITNLVDVCNLSVLNYTATTSNSFIGASGGTTIFLPNNPSVGQKISIADIAGNALGNNIKICSNNYNILNAKLATINTDYGSISFIFNNRFWSAVSFIN